MKRLSFDRTSVLVIGDVMLDRYYFGEVSRISPEAPVPVVRVTRTSESLGGAANVAANVAGLGGNAVLVGLAGDDEARHAVETLAAAQGITTELVSCEAVTTVKSRILGGHQQMLRLDFEHPQTPAAAAIATLKKRISGLLRSADVVILSDYGKGVCGDVISRFVIKAASAAGKPVIVDPKSEDWRKYSGAYCVTPNHKELCLALGRTVPNEDGPVSEQARRLVSRYRLQHVLVTRSERGMSLVGPRGTVHIHSRAQEVYDVSGAGDTVVATFAAAHAAGFKARDAVEIANCAAGIVVGKLGTVPVELEELREAVRVLGA